MRSVCRADIRLSPTPVDAGLDPHTASAGPAA
jgi:hypothetical protein